MFCFGKPQNGGFSSWSPLRATFEKGTLKKHTPQNTSCTRLISSKVALSGEAMALVLWRAADCGVNGVSDAVYKSKIPGAKKVVGVLTAVELHAACPQRRFLGEEMVLFLASVGLSLCCGFPTGFLDPPFSVARSGDQTISQT